MKTGRKNNVIFFYGQKAFTTKSEMITYLTRKFNYIPKTHLLLDLIDKDPQGVWKRRNKHNHFEKISGMSTEVHRCSTNVTLIYVYSYNRNVSYECNGNGFSSYSLAYENAKKLELYDKFIIPPSLLEWYARSTSIWKHIWMGCNYRCFSARNYEGLRYRTLKEINSYRKLNFKKGLKYNYYLESDADTFAKKISRTNPTSLCDTVSPYLMSGHISAPWGHLLVKRWYDEYKKYRPTGSKTVSKVTQHYQVLMNSQYRKVGVGIREKGNYIYIVLKFV
ncbi:CAP domain-containing protein [Strongyloides ratti]|nr:CAP domain-containing protein [Strongyloides ratti]CEF66598.1 CAP domain-containing protein [Strongyloides ratti]